MPEHSVLFLDLDDECHIRKRNIPAGAPRPKPLAPPSMSDLLACAHSAWMRDKRGIQTATRHIEVADWRIQGANHELLVLVSDSAERDPAFKDMRSGGLRAAGKRRDEGLVRDAHVLIRPVIGKPKALVLLTLGGRVGPSRMAAVLARYLNRGKDDAAHANVFSCPSPSGEEGKTVTLVHRLSASGHQGEALSAMLRSGSILGVTLVADDHENVDDAGALVRSRVQAVVKVKKVIGVKSFVDWLKSMRTDTGCAYGNARIDYRPPGQSKPQSTPSVPLDDLAEAFTRRAVVEAPYTDVSAAVINETLMAELRKLS